MSTREHARFARLVHRDGLWDGRRLLDPEWIRKMRRPCALRKDPSARRDRRSQLELKE